MNDTQNSPEVAAVFVVVGETDYERPDVVAAYSAARDAETEASRLNTLLKNAPERPFAWDDDDIAISEMEKFEHDYQKWGESFPRPDLSSVDRFVVWEIPLAKPNDKLTDSRP